VSAKRCAKSVKDRGRRVDERAVEIKKYGFFHFTSFVFDFDTVNLTAFSRRIYVLINFDFTFCILNFALSTFLRFLLGFKFIQLLFLLKT